VVASTLAWKLERDENVVAELRPSEGGYLAIANDEQVGGPFASIEEAVAAVPALRTLDAPGAWKLTTSLVSTAAAFMLEPTGGVEEVEVNGTFWETPTTSDANGRPIHDQRFFVPSDLPPDGVEEIELLFGATNMPGGVEGGFSITRYGPVCRLSEWEVDNWPIWIREPDDLQACLGQIGCMSHEFPVTKLSLPSPPDSIARDRTGRATPGAGFSEGDISLILSALTQFGGTVWVDGELWLEGHPAPHGLQRSLSGQPVNLYVQQLGTVWTHIPWTHPRQATWVVWRCGPLTAASLEGSPKAWSWFAVVSPDLEVAKRVLTANFTRSNVYAEDGILFGVVLEAYDSEPYLGLLLGDLEAALLYADAFGGVVLAGDDATLVEASNDGSVIRAWSWTSGEADPPAVAKDLPSIEDYRLLPGRYYRWPRGT
jgi:hypothetical protein